ncbi:MAG: ABC transporter substrate-binding protein [Bacillota bacterium]
MAIRNIIKKAPRSLITLLILLLATAVVAANGYPLKLKDQFGRDVIIPKEPKRIVSCSPGATETLFALGLDEEIVGVTNFCDYPEKAKKKAKIGDIVPLNVEKVVALAPDLVVAHELNGKDAVERLSGLGIPVLALRPTGFAEIIDSIRLLGAATNRRDAAEALARRLEETISRVGKKGANLKKRGLKVFIALGWDPSWTAGPGSYLDEAVRLAGAENIAHDLAASWGQMNVETVLARNPDVILTDVDPARIYADTIWKNVSAIRKKQVYRLIGDEFYRPGPRLIEAVEELARILEGCS